MKIYLVGGAVRDQLLGLPIQEKDWVVVGATVNEMLQQGFRQVGKDFPVFLHPKTHEEYALARVERKIGKGYTGFDFDASSSVTLEDDLLRRDLTINAMALSAEGELIDPFHGKEDLENKILRHVSKAFVEDPVRILRIARFAARFSQFGFTVAPETMSLMKEMVNAGEVDALVAERVWKEWEKALNEKNPEKFFEVLFECGALQVLFPAIQLNENLMKASSVISDPEMQFALSLFGVSLVDITSICDRYRVPTIFRELAILLTTFYPVYIKITEYPAEYLLDFLQKTDSFRRDVRFKKFLKMCEIIAAVYSQPQSTAFIMQAFEAAKISYLEADLKGLTGKQIGELIYQKRLNAIKALSFYHQ